MFNATRLGLPDFILFIAYKRKRPPLGKSLRGLFRLYDPVQVPQQGDMVVFVMVVVLVPVMNEHATSPAKDFAVVFETDMMGIALNIIVFIP